MIIMIIKAVTTIIIIKPGLRETRRQNQSVLVQAIWFAVPSLAGVIIIIITIIIIIITIITNIKSVIIIIDNYQD